MVTWFLDTSAAVIGLLIGSFVNVVIYRLPRGESLVRPGSHCPGCGGAVRAYDNVPLVSWVVLRGRCRTCHTRISARYPAVEAVTAALFVAATIRFGLVAEVGAYLVLFAALVALSMVDLDRHIVPRKIIYAAAVLTAPFLVAQVVVAGDPGRLADAAIAGAASFAVLGLVHVIRPEGMGFGDVRLAGLDGALLGFLGLGEAAVGLFLGVAAGAVVGVVLLALGRSAKTKLPFAPFLAVGTVAAVLVGPLLVRAWLG